MSKKPSRHKSRHSVANPNEDLDSAHEIASDSSQETAEISSHPLPSERLLIDHLPELDFATALVISPGRAQLAQALQSRNPHASIAAWFIDLHAATLAKEALGEKVDIHCSADLPEQQSDLVAMPVLMRGEAELTRELMQQGHERLATGGTLVTSVDNPRDVWLREQMEAIFDKVTTVDVVGGRIYHARKQRPLKKLRNFQAEVVFRDEENLIKLITRPGVFAHRQLDPGARQLLLSVEIDAGQRVLDLGCGSGALALAACKRASGVTALAVDSNARALECLRLSAELNGVTTIESLLNSDGRLPQAGSFDVVLCNPPYYSQFEIAEKMIRTATQALRSGGALLLVNKQPRWYEERLPQSLVDVEIFISGKYWVACGRKP